MWRVYVEDEPRSSFTNTRRRARVDALPSFGLPAQLQQGTVESCILILVLTARIRQKESTSRVPLPGLGNVANLSRLCGGAEIQSGYSHSSSSHELEAVCLLPELCAISMKCAAHM